MEIGKVLLKEKPDIMLVYGDTNSTLAGALASSKLHIPVAHVEAGLRSYNKKMPEEINRVLTDHISKYLFAPTETAVKNLEKEGIIEGVYNVGDVMFDVALESIKKVDEEKILSKFGLKPKDFILTTIHRAENTDNKENLKAILEALQELAKKGFKILFPIHPRTKNAIENYGLEIKENNNILIVEPVSYFEMVALEKNAKVIITDSGGVQKEGYFFGTPCVIPRNETEWVELVDIGFNVLSGAKRDKIVEETIKKFYENKKIKIENLYGEGNSSQKIVEILANGYNKN
jgi:UDP-N-acetylglucosamine 2-epimerase